MRIFEAKELEVFDMGIENAMQAVYVYRPIDS